MKQNIYDLIGGAFMRFRLKREISGFDEYINIYDEKNKLRYYSVEVDYARPKRLLYTKTQERIATVDMSPVEVEDIMNGYPLFLGTEKVGYYDDSLDMDSTDHVEFAHIVGPEYKFIENSERLTFRDYKLVDSDDGVVMTVKRSGADFVCDIARENEAEICLLIACIEFWRFVTTSRDF